MKVNYVFGTLSDSAFFAPSLVPGLQAKKTYNWIAKELSVSKETIARVKAQTSL